ncbi:MAG: hypothetical protein R2751_06325 [Bacteroidales bacterium]
MKRDRQFHYLNLDIVLGALAIAGMAAHLLHARVGWAWWICLPLTVWILYMGDHLLDAWRHRKKTTRNLHRYINRNRKSLVWALFLAVIADSLLILNALDRDYLLYAVILAGGVLVYYTVRHFFQRNRILYLPGELFVLLFYLAGTWLGPLVARGFSLDPEEILILVLNAGVLAMNLGVISYYDVKLDTRLGIASLARTLGRKSTRMLVQVLGIGLFLVILLQFLTFGVGYAGKFSIILAGMDILLLVVLWNPSQFGDDDRFRLAADAILLMGFLSFLIPA